MPYGEFRDGANKQSEEAREIAKIDALRRIAAALEKIVERQSGGNFADLKRWSR